MNFWTLYFILTLPSIGALVGVISILTFFISVVLSVIYFVNMSENEKYNKKENKGFWGQYIIK